MNAIQTFLIVGMVGFGTLAWGIDEHRPIQGGTTNPTPTGSTDHTRIQNEPEKIDNSATLTPDPQPLIPKARSTQPQKKPQTSVGTTPPAPSTKP